MPSIESSFRRRDQRIRRWLGVTLASGVLAASGMPGMCSSVAMAESPIPISSVAPISDLNAEAEALIAGLGKSLESEETYKKDAKVWKQGSSLLAVVSQAIVEHGEASPLKAAAPSLRAGAMQIARSKTLAEAQAGHKVITAAVAGELSADAKPEFDWAKLTKMHPSMEEMNTRAAAVRRSLKRLRKPEEEARDATALALLAVATYADTHEVKNEADKPFWQDLAGNFQKEMTATATAMRSKDAEKAKAVFAEGMKRCEACHEKFHNE